MKLKKVLLIVGGIWLAGYVYNKYIKPYQGKKVAIPAVPADVGQASIQNTGAIYTNKSIIPQPITAQVEKQIQQLQKVYDAVSKAGSSAVQNFLVMIKMQGFTVINGKVTYKG